VLTFMDAHCIYFVFRFSNNSICCGTDWLKLAGAAARRIALPRRHYSTGRSLQLGSVGYGVRIKSVDTELPRRGLVDIEVSGEHSIPVVEMDRTGS
jgi:hypothetical protein